jgi:hypothetical protein
VLDKNEKFWYSFIALELAVLKKRHSIAFAVVKVKPIPTEWGAREPVGAVGAGAPAV